MKLSQETIFKYFTLANSSNSWYTEDTNTFDFVDNHSDSLLVTIGDSWTYGDQLKDRTREVYGRIVADRLNCDWLNLGLCAAGNFWMAARAEELAKIIPTLEYKNIFVVCVFAGVGRWFNTEQDQYINYVDWFRENVSQKQDFDKLLEMLNQECVSRIINALQPFDHVQLKIGTNYLDQIGFDQLLPDQILSKPWYKIMNCQAEDKIYTCVYWERISTAIEFIDPSLHEQYKEWVIDIIDTTMNRVEMLKDPEKFLNYHPTAVGHAQWASYVLEQLQ